MTATNAINTQDVGADVVLVVDLDGTLSRTDTLHEMVLRLLASQPQVLFRFPGWLADGKAKFKAKLADQIVVDPADLPLNDAVLDEVRAARATGRRTALVSAADYRQVKAVAEALGLFDEAYGSAEGRNLKGSTKATFLTEQFGQKRFDYIGDARADL